MPDLIATSVEATAWMSATLAAYDGGAVFGRFASAVIWSDARDVDGELLVACEPHELVMTISANPLPLLLGHDPSQPIGKVLEAKVFRSSSGGTFVAAVLGFYEDAPKLRFNDLGLAPDTVVRSPAELRPLPADIRFAISADPREVDMEWLREITREAPISVDVIGRSDNAAEVSQTLVIMSVAFVTLVWNPFIKTIGTEAGKDTYAAMRAWLKRLSAGLALRTKPILELQSFYGECRVSFMLRGSEIANHYLAHDALSEAAIRAAHLVEQMKAARVPPVLIVYEFHPTDTIWYPLYAELADGRLVSDKAILVAAEKLPSGLSLGLTLTGAARPSKVTQLPSSRSNLDADN